MSITAIPTEPKKVYLHNLYPGSSHSDVKIFKAALCRFGYKVDITPIFDPTTEKKVSDIQMKAFNHEVNIGKFGVPNENFIKLVGLELR